MHRQMHRTDVVSELAGRRSKSLVARSKKLKLSHPIPKLWLESNQSKSPRTKLELIDESPSTIGSQYSLRAQHVD